MQSVLSTKEQLWVTTFVAVPVSCRMVASIAHGAQLSRAVQLARLWTGMHPMVTFQVAPHAEHQAAPTIMESVGSTAHANNKVDKGSSSKQRIQGMMRALRLKLVIEDTQLMMIREAFWAYHLESTYDIVYP